MVGIRALRRPGAAWSAHRAVWQPQPYPGAAEARILPAQLVTEGAWHMGPRVQPLKRRALQAIQKAPMQQQRHEVSRALRVTHSVPNSCFKRTSNKPASYLQLAFIVSGCLSVLLCIHIPPGKQKAFLLHIWLFWPSTKLPFGSCAIRLHPCRICIVFPIYTNICIYIYIFLNYL